MYPCQGEECLWFGGQQSLFVWAPCAFCHVCYLEQHVSEQFRDVMVHHIILSHLDISEIMHWDDSLRAINLLFNTLLMIMAVRDCIVLMPCFLLRNLTQVLCTHNTIICCRSILGFSETQVSQHYLVSARKVYFMFSAHSLVLWTKGQRNYKGTSSLLYHLIQILDVFVPSVSPAVAEKKKKKKIQAMYLFNI